MIPPNPIYGLILLLTACTVLFIAAVLVLSALS